MEVASGRARLRHLLIGGVVGAFAGLAAGRRRRPAVTRPTTAGLRAFEGAPCYREAVEREREWLGRSRF